MRGKINVDAEAIKYLYKQYKEYILPSFVIFVSVILLFLSVIPQIKDLVNIARQRDAELKKLEVLKNNLDLLSSLDNSTLDTQFEAITSALPQNKDFEGIIYAVSGAAQRSGVGLGDFEFQVGDLSDTSVASGEFPYLSTKLNIQASNQQAADFITELFKSVPLAEVLDVSVSERSTKLSVVFYYKPIPQIEINDYTPLKKLSAEKLELVNELSAWKSYPVINIQIPVATDSSQTSSPF
ncbi:MAG: hypothetical protein HYT08_00085 [Candidatus Levybacteria bacterium]|nr:hypothetical protein [Candidatus Levybacteria bacterium]